MSINSEVKELQKQGYYGTADLGIIIFLRYQNMTVQKIISATKDEKDRRVYFFFKEDAKEIIQPLLNIYFNSAGKPNVNALDYNGTTRATKTMIAQRTSYLV